MFEKVDMGKVYERIQKNGVHEAAFMCRAFLQELSELTEGYVEKVRSLMQTYKDEVCLMDCVVSLSCVAHGNVVIQHNVGCGMKEGKEAIIKSLNENGAEDGGEA